MPTPTREQRSDATALAMDIIASTLDKPDQHIKLESQQETGAVIGALATYAGILLLHTAAEDTTALDLAEALRSAATLLRTS
ncbi:hypothetical protein [Williamsia sp. DF01-3]|uniref:hypothetical protein n=1 Tax=Williamsia sp. DF01-3 TaxID=2934157 RepID=UPI001FF36FC0|nr:hypothetical protein [Williamsia sp. DF01-3]MCK0516975.1 hypothetical protein [Williamsia sp. DF01-3]